MWISKKKWCELEKRFADLEKQVQGQQRVSAEDVVEAISRQIQGLLQGRSLKPSDLI